VTRPYRSCSCREPGEPGKPGRLLGKSCPKLEANSRHGKWYVRFEADSGLVFTRENGQPWRPAYLSEHFRLLVRRAGLPPVRLHDLRHGAATLSLSAGVDIKIVQEMLGRSTSAFTRDVYTSVVPEIAAAAAEAVAAIVPRRAAR